MILVSLLVVDVSDLVSGFIFGLVFQFGSELPFATLVDQIELRGCLWFRYRSRFRTWLRPPVCDACRENQASSMFLVSFLNLAPRAHLRCLSSKSSFVDVSGLVFEPGSEGSVPMPVE